MSRFHDDSTFASDPAKIRLSRRMMRRHWPPGFFFKFSPLYRRFEARVAEHIQFGDSRAAIAVGLNPLLVAAFTDELDAVAILEYPDSVVKDLRTSVGDRLLTVNTYVRGTEIVGDISAGPLAYDRYVNFYPIIAEFVSPDLDKIENRKADIDEREWQRCQTMADDYLRDFPGQFRDGSPLYSTDPAPGTRRIRPVLPSGPPRPKRSPLVPPPPEDSGPPPPPPSAPTPPPPRSD